MLCNILKHISMIPIPSIATHSFLSLELFTHHSLIQPMTAL